MGPFLSIDMIAGFCTWWPPSPHPAGTRRFSEYARRTGLLYHYRSARRRRFNSPIAFPLSTELDHLGLICTTGSPSLLSSQRFGSSRADIATIPPTMAQVVSQSPRPEAVAQSAAS